MTVNRGYTLGGALTPTMTEIADAYGDAREKRTVAIMRDVEVGCDFTGRDYVIVCNSRPHPAPPYATLTEVETLAAEIAARCNETAYILKPIRSVSAEKRAVVKDI